MTATKKLRLTDIDRLILQEAKAMGMNEQFIQNLYNRMRGIDPKKMASMQTGRPAGENEDYDSIRRQKEDDFEFQTGKDTGLKGASATAYDSAVAQASLLDKKSSDKDFEKAKDFTSKELDTTRNKTLSWAEQEMEAVEAELRGEIEANNEKVLSWAEQEIEAAEANLADKLMSDEKFMSGLLSRIEQEMVKKFSQKRVRK